MEFVIATPDGFQDKEKQELRKEEEAPRDISGWKWFLALSAILSSIFLYALGNTVAADIQPVIIKDFGHVEELPWLSLSFLLGATATNLIWDKTYGHFNSKWLYIFNEALSELGSAICSASPSINVMILGRAFCGIGRAGLYVGVMTLIAATTTLPERPIYVVGTGLTWGMRIVLGPVVGGAFSDSSVSWRWAFNINLFIRAVYAPVYFSFSPARIPDLASRWANGPKNWTMSESFYKWVH